MDSCIKAWFERRPTRHGRRHPCQVLAGLDGCAGGEIREIQEYSRIVEENSAVLAAKKRATEDLAALEEAMQVPEEGTISIVTWHVNVHQTLAGAAHNRLLYRAMKQMRRELFIATPPVGDGREEKEFRRFPRGHVQRGPRRGRGASARGHERALRLHGRSRSAGPAAGRAI